ncbi:MAG: L,D-transpeptidase [Bacteroidales bacterium]|nr:L,D-transpeptidase [Bacteroidales bacterium]
MRKLLFGVLVLMLTACGGKANNVKEKEQTMTDTVTVEEPVVFGALQHRDSCFIVISKPELHLSVYESQEGDTVLLARYPVCVGKNLGQKEKTGDMKTPECGFGNPFSITEIKPASSWTHDFGDGRGPILAYGNWFMRLKTPGFTGIGIHGSTNNENSVPGRGSEGCIRLLNADLDELKETYAFVGMKVIVLADR